MSVAQFILGIVALLVAVPFFLFVYRVATSPLREIDLERVSDATRQRWSR